MENNAINNYYLSLYNDAFIFSENVEEIFPKFYAINREEYILSVIHKINEISERRDYPNFTIENLGKIITHMEEVVKNNEYVALARRKYNELVEIPMNEEIYKYEAMIKFFDLDYAIIDDIEINKLTVEASIAFDLVAYHALLFNSDIIEENYFYIASLKKFFTEFPELFSIDKINKNAIKILEKNSKYEESKRLMYKLKHIDKFTENNFDYARFKSLMDYVFVQNMLFNREYYRLNRSIVGEDKIISLYEIIKNNLLFSDKMKKNALEMMSDYKEDSIDKMDVKLKKAKLVEYNEAIGKLNLMKYDITSFIASENLNRFEGLDKIKAFIKPLNLEDYQKLIQNDLLLLTELTSDNEPRKKYKKAYLSFNKFLNIVPDMFDNENIYKKSMQLLKEKNLGTLKVRKKIKKQFTR